MQEFIQKMPKAELHVHIEGTLEPELSFALAQKNGVSLSAETPEQMIAAYNFHDLPSFLDIYYAGMSVLIEEEDFYALTMAYFEKAAAQHIAATPAISAVRRSNPRLTCGSSVTSLVGARTRPMRSSGPLGCPHPLRRRRSTAQ